MTNTVVRIATRKSPLALWQANYVKKQLKILWPEIQIELLPMLTSGDRFIQGNKGLFVKELEEALLDMRADLAVHSMKDVPNQLPAGLSIGAILKRENAMDCFLSYQYPSLDDLPNKACIGTISLRRQSQLLAYKNNFNIQPLRGNIQTRLQKLARGEFDAIILANAGLIRMKIRVPYQTIFKETIMLPACGQGALGIECRNDDINIQKLIRPLNNETSAICVNTERYVNHGLGGHCHTPLALYCKPEPNEQLTLQARLFKPDGQKKLSYQATRPIREHFQLAEACLADLRRQGAAEWLAH
jgi:hydroxymethylbilane synthase